MKKIVFLILKKNHEKELIERFDQMIGALITWSISEKSTKTNKQTNKQLKNTMSKYFTYIFHSFSFFHFSGMNPAECETHYLAIAANLEHYGMDRHTVKVINAVNNRSNVLCTEV